MHLWRVLSFTLYSSLLFVQVAQPKPTQTMLSLAAFLWLPALALSASAQPRDGFADVARYLQHRAVDGVILDKSTRMDSAFKDYTLFK